MTQEIDIKAMKKGIAKALDEMATPLRDNYSARTWTAAVLDTLTNEGNSHPFVTETCAPKTKAPKATWGSEWLFDACWLRYGKDKDQTTRNLVLAAECEWWARTPFQHRNDFDKLVVAKADLRLLICEVWAEKDVKPLVDAFKRYASDFNGSKGDKYMISCWVHNTKEFSHNPFVVGQ